MSKRGPIGKGSIMLGQLRTRLANEALLPLSDAAADEELVAAARMEMNWV